MANVHAPILNESMDLQLVCEWCPSTHGLSPFDTALRFATYDSFFVFGPGSKTMQRSIGAKNGSSWAFYRHNVDFDIDSIDQFENIKDQTGYFRPAIDAATGEVVIDIVGPDGLYDDVGHHNAYEELEKARKDRFGAVSQPGLSICGRIGEAYYEGVAPEGLDEDYQPWEFVLHDYDVLLEIGEDRSFRLVQMCGSESFTDFLPNFEKNFKIVGPGLNMPRVTSDDDELWRLEVQYGVLDEEEYAKILDLVARIENRGVFARNEPAEQREA